tara:strand:+ start:3736 stop:4062 length:327 start_codon:yes stop_codon:yes gene_type:complete
MRTLIALLFAATAYSQQLPSNAYGTWMSFEYQDQLTIWEDTDQTVFIRSNNGSVLAQGIITSEGNNFVITRTDVKDSYALATFLGNETMVITKPREAQSWLWIKISNY